MITTTYKYRFYPNKNQIKIIDNISESYLYFYDKFISRLKGYYYKYNKFLSLDETIKTAYYDSIPERKYYRELGEKNAIKSCCIHSLAQVKNNINIKINNNYKYGYLLFSGMFSYQDDKFYLPKVGKIKIHSNELNYLNHEIKNIEIKKNNLNEYYILIMCKIDDSEIPKIKRSTNKSIGIDFSMKDFFISSENIKSDFPFKKIRELIIEKKRIKKINSNKKVGSINYLKNQIKIYKIFKKIKNIKNNYYITLSNYLTDKYDYICCEDLYMNGMINVDIYDNNNEKFNFNNTINKLGFKKFLIVLKHKCELKGKKMLYVNRYYKSSQICNNCGYVNNITKDISIRKVTCPSCKLTYDRDINAAKNIRDEAIRTYKSSFKKIRF